MKMRKKVIALIGLALFLANASFAQQVKTDYDRAANFSQYKTYSWEKVQTADPLWVDRIKAAVNAALAASETYRCQVKPFSSTDPSNHDKAHAALGAPYVALNWPLKK